MRIEYKMLTKKRYNKRLHGYAGPLNLQSYG